MSNDVQLNWLFSQGLIPLFGAGAVYLVWGAFKKLAAPETRYVWREAVDSMGWLYGAIVIAVQSASLFFEGGTSYRAMGFLTSLCAILCGMQLLAAMDERGAIPDWRPPIAFKIVAFILVTATLSCAYFAHGVSKREASSIASGTHTENRQQEVK